MEEKGEPDDGSFFLGKDYLGGPLDEKGLVERGLVCDDIVRALSYTASFWMKARTSPASSGLAGRIVKAFIRYRFGLTFRLTPRTTIILFRDTKL